MGLRTGNMKICIVNAPFQPLEIPSTGVTYVHSAVKHAGYDCRLADLNYPFANFLINRIPAMESFWENGHPAHPGQLIFSGLSYPENLATRALPAVELVESLYAVDFEELLADSREFTDAWLDAQDFENADVIGFSVLNYQIIPALYLVSEVRKRAPKAKIVFGGFYCSKENSEALMRLEPAIDFCVHGEGEKTILELLERVHDADAYPGIAGIVYRDREGTVRGNPSRPTMTGADLDSLPFPEYDWISLADRKRFKVKIPVVSIRGCYWGKCTYCSDFRYNKVTYARSAGNVVAEMIHQSRKYDTTRFYFSDLASNDTVERMNGIAEGLIASGIKFEYGILLKPDNIDLNMLKNLRASGCRFVQYGIESFSNELLRKMAKGCKAIDNLRAIKLTEMAGMQAISNIIKLYPTEAIGDVVENYQALLRYPELINGQVFGTPIAFRLRQGASAVNLMKRTPHRVLDRAIHGHYFPENLAKEIPDIEWIVDIDGPDLVLRSHVWKQFEERLKLNVTYRAETTYDDDGTALKLRKVDGVNATVKEHEIGGEARDLYLLLEDVRDESELLAASGLDRETFDDFMDFFEEENLVFRDGTRLIATVYPGIQAPKFETDFSTVESKSGVS